MNNLRSSLIVASLLAAAYGGFEPITNLAVAQTPEPPQTPEQKQWYLDRAQARRDRRAANKKRNSK